MGIFSKLFPKWAASMLQAKLAAALIEFVQRLHGGAIFKAGLEQEMLDKIERGEKFTDFQNTAIDISKHAQLFVLNLILQTCLEYEMQDSGRVLETVIYVMTETHDLDPAEARDLAVSGAQWCGAVKADLESANGGEAQRTSETEREVFLVSRKTAVRFSRAIGTRTMEPTEEEIAYFTSHCMQAKSGK